MSDHILAEAQLMGNTLPPLRSNEFVMPLIRDKFKVRKMSE
jgi:hypothetical protein